MAKLHEVLIVQQQLSGQAETCRKELAQATFPKRRHLFEEKVIVFQPTGEGEKETREQQSDLQSTVAQELRWIQDIMAKAVDAGLQVQDACTNPAARADIVLDDGTVLLQRVPVLGLLELEKRANEWKQLVEAIPTLDPAKGFKPDEARGHGVYVAREVVKTRTKKTKNAIVLFPATKEHPAQTALIDEDVPVGRLVEREWSGLITPTEKADMLARAEALTRAIKQARMRANDAPAENAFAGSANKLMNFVFGQNGNGAKA